MAPYDNPRKSNDKKLQVYRAKEIKFNNYEEMNGTPGLHDFKEKGEQAQL